MKNYTPSHLKDMNRITVYRALRKKEEMFRNEIAKETGISAPTVLKIVDYMLEQNLLCALGEGDAAVGRKPQMLALNPDAMYTAGVIFEGSYVRAGLMNFKKELLAVKNLSATGNFHTDAKALIPQLLNDLLRETGVRRERLVGIGIGVPGAYNTETHVVGYAPLVGIFEPADISGLITWLENDYKLRVIVKNDVNLCVIGEYESLKLEQDDLIYIHVGTGLGAGIILNGRLREGRSFQCGEIGYTALSRNFVTQKSVPGWLESRMNAAALKEAFGFDCATGSGDRAQVTAYAADYLAACINNMIVTIDADKIALSGAVVDALGEELLSAVREKFTHSLSPLCIWRSKDSKAGVSGACLEALEKAVMEVLTE